jgi:hypothetical protein
MDAVGAWFGLTLIVRVARPVAPCVSVTVNVAVNDPAVEYTCETLAPEPLPPSPKVHANVAMLSPVSESLEAEASNATASGALPVEGDATNEALGA